MLDKHHRLCRELSTNKVSNSKHIQGTFEGWQDGIGNEDRLF